MEIGEQVGQPVQSVAPAYLNSKMMVLMDMAASKSLQRLNEVVILPLTADILRQMVEEGSESQ